MDCAGNAVGDTTVGEATVTTRPIPCGVPLRAVHWLADDALTLPELHGLIAAFFRRAPEGDMAIAGCAPFLAQWERKSVCPGIAAIRSPGE